MPCAFLFAIAKYLSLLFWLHLFFQHERMMADSSYFLRVLSKLTRKFRDLYKQQLIHTKKVSSMWQREEPVATNLKHLYLSCAHIVIDYCQFFIKILSTLMGSTGGCKLSWGLRINSQSKPFCSQYQDGVFFFFVRSAQSGYSIWKSQLLHIVKTQTGPLWVVLVGLSCRGAFGSTRSH